MELDYRGVPNKVVSECMKIHLFMYCNAQIFAKILPQRIQNPHTTDYGKDHFRIQKKLWKRS